MGDIPITVAYGDGIGPEIMAATLTVLEAAGARLTLETVEIGEKVYKKGIEIHPELPMRHPAQQGRAISDLLALLGQTDRQ